MQDGESVEQVRNEARIAFNDRFNSPHTSRDLTPEQRESISNNFNRLPELLERIASSTETKGMLDAPIAIPNTTWSQRMILENALRASKGEPIEQFNSWGQHAELELTPHLGGDRYGIHFTIGEGDDKQDLAKVEIRSSDNGSSELAFVAYGRDYAQSNNVTTYVIHGDTVTVKTESFLVNPVDPEIAEEESRLIDESAELDRLAFDDDYHDEE